MTNSRNESGNQKNSNDIPINKEKDFFAINGIVVIGIMAILLILAISSLKVLGLITLNISFFTNLVTILIPVVALTRGFFILNPGQGAIATRLGKFEGVKIKNGFYWTLPWYKVRRRTMRIETIFTDTIVVNDKEGNPVELKLKANKKRVNLFDATFKVEDDDEYIMQALEFTLKELAANYEYPFTDLREDLLKETKPKALVAGNEILDLQLNNVAYSSEIASAMLQKQKAKKTVEAKTEIAKGLVESIEEFIKLCKKSDDEYLKSLTKEDYEKFIPNLMIAMISDDSPVTMIPVKN